MSIHAQSTESIDELPSAAYQGSMLTGGQIRAARGLLGWSVERLSSEAGVSYPTVVRAEAAGAQSPSLRVQSLDRIELALERAGIIFIRAGEASPAAAGPGVRLNKV